MNTNAKYLDPICYDKEHLFIPKFQHREVFEFPKTRIPMGREMLADGQRMQEQLI